MLTEGSHDSMFEEKSSGENLKKEKIISALVDEKKRKKVTTKRIITIIVVLGLLIAGTLNYRYYSLTYWDGGKWEGTYAIPSNGKDYNSPLFIEYHGLIYSFFHYRSKSTYNGDDVISEDEYSLTDVVYRIFNGTNWSDEQILSDPDDETSEYISDIVIYDDKIFVVRQVSTRLVINNNDSERDDINWNSSTLLQSFDGNDWVDIDQLSFLGDSTTGPRLSDLLVWNNSIIGFWALGPNSNGYYQYGYKFFNDSNWTEPKIFSMPIQKSSSPIFTLHNDELWATWRVSVYKGIAKADIYLGKFNGTEMKIVTRMTQGVTNESTTRPHITVYKEKIYVTWEGNDGIICRSYYSNVKGKAMNIGNGLEVFSIVYNKNLYVIFQNYDYRSIVSGDPDFFIKSFNGDEWSGNYRLTNSQFPGTDDPKAFVYNNELFVYWDVNINSKRFIVIKRYNS